MSACVSRARVLWLRHGRQDPETRRLHLAFRRCVVGGAGDGMTGRKRRRMQGLLGDWSALQKTGRRGEVCRSVMRALRRATPAFIWR